MSFLSVAIEELDEAVVETEYSQFLQLSDSQLREIIQRFKGCSRVAFSESKLSSDRGHTRMRHYPFGDDGQSRYELTTKVCKADSSDVGVDSKIEYNVDIPEEVYCSLNTLASSQVARIRIIIPITKEGSIIYKRDGSELAWELDIFVSAANVDNATSLVLSNWIKLELEVDKATLDNIVDYIPFEYEMIIQSDSKVPEERAQIEHLYNNEYNLLGKVTDATIQKILNQ